MQELFRRRLPRAPLVIAVCLAFFAGVGLARYAHAQQLWWLLAPALAVAITIRQHSALTLICLVVLSFGVGWWRGSVVAVRLDAYDHFAYKKVVIVGRASGDAVYANHSQLSFTLDHVHLMSPDQASLPGSLAISGFGAPAVYRGDSVQVSGKLFLMRGGARASIGFAELAVLRSSPAPIDQFRRRFAAGVQSALPEPLASLGMGLLVGQRNTLPAEVSSVLLAVGLTHIIAVSGYNLTIMVSAARRIAGRRSKFQTMAGCVLLIAVFLLLTGSSPSIVRASIISVLGLSAWYYGRTIRPLVLLLVAGAISVGIEPLYLWGNVSWYLSFLAFFGVLVVAPLVTKRLYGKRAPGLLPQIIIESCCAQAMTVPYVLYIFGQISLVALLANVLVVALVPLAMLLCVAAGVAGMGLPALAGWFAWPARLLLTYMVDVAELLSRIPHALVSGIGLSFTGMLVLYVVLAVVVLLLVRNTRECGTITDKEQRSMVRERTFQVVDN